LLDAGLSGKEVTRIISAGEGEMIVGIVPLTDPARAEIIGAVVVSQFIPKSLMAKMREISQAFVEYKQLKILKKPIKFSYMMALLMVTLLIVFSATWFGFHLAKDITVPIKDLAEAKAAHEAAAKAQAEHQAQIRETQREIAAIREQGQREVEA
jgi:two-component system nitrogen regulation sensor histidine kinase NtrY